MHCPGLYSKYFHIHAWSISHSPFSLPLVMQVASLFAFGIRRRWRNLFHYCLTVHSLSAQALSFCSSLPPGICLCQSTIRLGGNFFFTLQIYTQQMIHLYTTLIVGITRTKTHWRRPLVFHLLDIQISYELHKPRRVQWALII